MLRALPAGRLALDGQPSGGGGGQGRSGGRCQLQAERGTGGGGLRQRLYASDDEVPLAGSSDEEQEGSAAQQAQARQQAQQQPQRVCSLCGTDSSSNWRWHPLTRASLCGSCRGYMTAHAGELPPVGVQCRQCSSSSPGPWKKAGWRAHPVTGERWLCQPCFHATRRQAAEEDLARRACHHCAATNTCAWRGVGDAWRCNSCHQFASTHRGRLPPLDPKCLECGGSSPGSGRGATWRFHPLTGKEWCCSPCWFSVRARAKWQRQWQRRRRRRQQRLQLQLRWQQPQRVCSHCGTDSSSSWRWHPLTRAPLCGSCCSHMDKFAGELPPVGVQCRQCDSSSPGPWSHAAWHAHPVTGQQWLCSPCFYATRRQATHVDRVCHHCATTTTCSWRRVGDTWRCIACHQFASTHRGRLPPLAPECLECGGDSPGSGRGATWRFHPLTGKEWVCNRCFFAIRTKAKWERQRRQQGAEPAAAAADVDVDVGGLMTGDDEDAYSPAAKQVQQQQQQQQAQQQQQQQPEAVPLFLLLVGAASGGGAAAVSHELCAAFCSFIDALPPAEQAPRVSGCISAGRQLAVGLPSQVCCDCTGSCSGLLLLLRSVPQQRVPPLPLQTGGVPASPAVHRAAPRRRSLHGHSAAACGAVGFAGGRRRSGDSERAGSAAGYGAASRTCSSCSRIDS